MKKAPRGAFFQDQFIRQAPTGLGIDYPAPKSCTCLIAFILAFQGPSVHQLVHARRKPRFFLIAIVATMRIL